MDILIRVEEEQRRRGWSMRQMGHVLGVSAQTVLRRNRHPGRYTIEEAVRASRAFEVPLCALIIDLLASQTPTENDCHEPTL